MKRLTTAIVVLAVAWSGCTTAEKAKRVEGDHPAPGMIDRPGLEKYESTSVEPGTVLRRYELAWEPRKSAVVVNNLTAVAALMLDEPSARRLGAEQKAAKPFEGVVEVDAVGSWVKIKGVPILAKYDPRYDEIRMLNKEREAFGANGKDIGIDEARKAAEKILARLGKQGIIDPRLYANAAMQVGYEMVGSGSVKGDVGPGRVNAYRITYRPRLDGFEMANAGVRLGILPTGELVSLRAGGVRPKGKWQDGRLVPTGEGGTERAQTDANTLMRRFYQQVPKDVEPLVAWSRIMYVMPEDERQAVVAPMLVISWTAQRVHDGVRVASRRKTLAYSLVDPKAGPVDFDAPAAKHETPRITRDAQSE